MLRRAPGSPQPCCGVPLGAPNNLQKLDFFAQKIPWTRTLLSGSGFEPHAIALMFERQDRSPACALGMTVVEVVSARTRRYRSAPGPSLKSDGTNV
jgi:hypothetical protein